MPHTPAVHHRTTDIALPVGAGSGLTTTVKASRRAPAALYNLALIGILLILGYMGNTAWNVIHLNDFDFTPLLAAATLPLPFKGQTVPRWIGVASAAVFGLDVSESTGALLAPVPACLALAHLAIDQHGSAWQPEDDCVRRLCASPRGTPTLLRYDWRTIIVQKPRWTGRVTAWPSSLRHLNRGRALPLPSWHHGRRRRHSMLAA